MDKKPLKAYFVETIWGECWQSLGPLMIRYKLLHTPWFGLYFHRIMRSDMGRHFHDHPWSFLSLILRGGYTEHTPRGSERFSSGRILWRRIAASPAKF